MKLETKPLQTAMATAVRFLDKKNVVPVTGMVKLDFTSECLQVTTTNYDRAFTATIPMFCPEPCSVLIDGLRFHSFLSQITDETFECTIDEKSFTVKRKGGSAKFLRCLDKYPAVPQLPEADGVIINGDVFAEALHSALCGTDEDTIGTAAWQNIIEMRITDNEFRCLASDTKRIVVVEGKCEGNDQTIQLPLSIARLASTIVDSGDVKIIEGENHIFIVTDSVFSFRKLTAHFPGLDGFFEIAKFELGFTAEAEDLHHALSLVRSMADNRLRSVKWVLDDKVTFSANASDVGHVEESLDVKPEIQVTTGFNIDWLLAITRQLSGSIECEFVTLKGNTNLQINRKRLTKTKFIVGGLTIRD